MARDAVTVAEAAQLLGVNRQRVHQLLNQGDLRGERRGHGWFIFLDSIHARNVQNAPRGRPLSAASAWDLLSRVAGGDEPVPTLDELAVRVRRRAHRRPVRVLPGLIESLRTDSVVVTGGAAAAAAAGAPVDDATPPFDLYVRADDLDDLERRFRPSSTGDVNVILHVVPLRLWPFTEGQRDAAPIVAAVDLAEAGDRAAIEARRVAVGTRRW